MFNRVRHQLMRMVNPDYDQHSDENLKKSKECSWCTRLGNSSADLTDFDGTTVQARACNLHVGSLQTLINEWLDVRLGNPDVRERLGLSRDVPA